MVTMDMNLDRSTHFWASRRISSAVASVGSSEKSVCVYICIYIA